MAKGPRREASVPCMACSDSDLRGHGGPELEGLALRISSCRRGLLRWHHAPSTITGR